MGDGGRTSTPGAEAAPTVGWASGPLGVVQAADREIARQVAVRARAVAAFAASRPAWTDRQQGERGAMSAERWAARPEVLRSVSEWATPELAIAVNLTQQAAQDLLQESLTLVTRLPGTLAALESGLLHRGHLWHLLDKVAPIADDRLRAEVEADLLAWVGRRQTVTSPAQLGDKARRVVARRDAAAAGRRLARALKERGISIRPERADGMAAVTVVCTLPEARAFYAALVQCAEALVDEPGGPVRTRGQKMVDALVDLVLRPGKTDLPPVQALLTIVASVHTALGGDQLGEVDGMAVPAEMARQLARAFAGLDTTPSGAEDITTDRTARDGTAADGIVTEAAGSPEDSATTDDSAVTTGSTVGTDMETRPVDTEPNDTASSAGGTSWPDDVEGGPVERAAQELSGFDFDQWLQELVRSGFGDDPAPDDPGWLPGGPPDPSEWDAGPWHDPCEWLDDHDHDHDNGHDQHLPAPDPDSDADADADADGSASPDGDPPGGGWWAAADCAVDQAGATVHAARLALGAARRMVRTAQKADAADEAVWEVSTAGRVTAADDALAALAVAADTQREELAALLMATGGGGLADQPRIAVTDAITGALLTLTDLPQLRRTGTCGRPACRRRPEACGHDLTGRPGLGRPGPTDAYAPGAALDRFVRARDRRCRFPGCRRRVPKAGELDHHRPHAEGGGTAAANLAGYCTGDHRGKHQAPGWRHDLAPDGSLTVTTPTGLTATTQPPPY
ncbi:HNH endonuclease signature motif containing protein [Geodermatophilus obscurus]|nr:HNH endonuclease signature motif containing protein [Geodermatophilus obscurus]